MGDTPAGMTSDHIKSHLQKFRANSKISREEFLADYARALREAQAKADEAVVRVPPSRRRARSMCRTPRTACPAHRQMAAPPSRLASALTPWPCAQSSRHGRRPPRRLAPPPPSLGSWRHRRMSTCSSLAQGFLPLPTTCPPRQPRGSHQAPHLHLWGTRTTHTRPPCRGRRQPPPSPRPLP